MCLEARCLAMGIHVTIYKPHKLTVCTRCLSEGGTCSYHCSFKRDLSILICYKFSFDISTPDSAEQPLQTNNMEEFLEM
jgi:hypothetical protein